MKAVPSSIQLVGMWLQNVTNWSEVPKLLNTWEYKLARVYRDLFDEEPIELRIFFLHCGTQTIGLNAEDLNLLSSTASQVRNHFYIFLLTCGTFALGDKGSSWRRVDALTNSETERHRFNDSLGSLMACNSCL